MTTAGIEPRFALAYRREHLLDDRTLIELYPLVIRYAREQKINSEQCVRAQSRSGSLATDTLLSPPARALLATAAEINPDDHLRTQTAFPKHTDNPVPKTIKLPESATADDIAAIDTRAWAPGLKGITFYRYGSRDRQVLRLGEGDVAAAREHFARCNPHACA